MPSVSTKKNRRRQSSKKSYSKTKKRNHKNVQFNKKKSNNKHKNIQSGGGYQFAEQLKEDGFLPFQKINKVDELKKNNTLKISDFLYREYYKKTDENIEDEEKYVNGKFLPKKFIDHGQAHAHYYKNGYNLWYLGYFKKNKVTTNLSPIQKLLRSSTNDESERHVFLFYMTMDYFPLGTSDDLVNKYTGRLCILTFQDVSNEDGNDVFTDLYFDNIYNLDERIENCTPSQILQDMQRHFETAYDPTVGRVLEFEITHYSNIPNALEKFTLTSDIDNQKINELELVKQRVKDKNIVSHISQEPLRLNNLVFFNSNDGTLSEYFHNLLQLCKKLFIFQPRLYIPEIEKINKVKRILANAVKNTINKSNTNLPHEVQLNVDQSKDVKTKLTERVRDIVESAQAEANAVEHEQKLKGVKHPTRNQKVFEHFRLNKNINASAAEMRAQVDALTKEEKEKGKISLTFDISAKNDPAAQSKSQNESGQSEKLLENTKYFYLSGAPIAAENAYKTSSFGAPPVPIKLAQDNFQALSDALDELDLDDGDFSI